MNDFAYRLKTVDIGAIILDANLMIRSISPSAAALLGVDAALLIGKPLLAMHPGDAQAKVSLLLSQAREARQAAASMMVPFPGRTLHVRACPLDDGASDAGGGYAVILHSLEPDAATTSTARRTAPRLLKLPVETGGITVFVDPETVYFVQAEGHYSRLHTSAGDHFCALALAELERRLDPEVFFRCHRSYLVNLRHVSAFRRRDATGELVMARPRDHVVPVSRSRVPHLKELLAV